MRQQIFPAPRAWPCRFHWQAYDRASIRSRLRAIPNATFCRRSFSCVLPTARLAIGADDCRFAISCGVVHRLDFGSISRIDGVATNFAHGREQPALRGKSIADNGEISNPAVMRKFGIHGTQRRLNGCGFELPGHEYAEIAAPIADHHDLLRRGKKPDDFFLDRFGRYVVPGIQNDQVLDAAADAPISAHVDFALVAAVKPSVMQRAGSFLWAIPVARENVWPAHHDLLIFRQL